MARLLSPKSSKTRNKQKEGLKVRFTQTRQRGRWTKGEENLLIELTKRFVKPDGKIDWKEVSDRIEGRTRNACWNKYEDIREYTEAKKEHGGYRSMHSVSQKEKELIYKSHEEGMTYLEIHRQFPTLRVNTLRNFCNAQRRRLEDKRNPPEKEQEQIEMEQSDEHEMESENESETKQEGEQEQDQEQTEREEEEEGEVQPPQYSQISEPTMPDLYFPELPPPQPLMPAPPFMSLPSLPIIGKFVRNAPTQTMDGTMSYVSQPTMLSNGNMIGWRECRSFSLPLSESVAISETSSEGCSSWNTSPRTKFVGNPFSTAPTSLSMSGFLHPLQLPPEPPSSMSFK